MSSSIIDYAKEIKINADWISLERRIQEAEDKNDLKKMAQLVPQHYAILRRTERASQTLQAIDDWRIVYKRLYILFGHQNALSYFDEMAGHGDFYPAPETRMSYARTIDFYYKKQLWTLNELTDAGVNRLMQVKSFAQSNAIERGGSEDHPMATELKELLLDTENVGYRQVPAIYEEVMAGEGRSNGNPGNPYIDVYYEGKVAKVVVWEPGNANTESPITLGVLYLNTPKHEDYVSKFLANKIQVNRVDRGT